MSRAGLFATALARAFVDDEAEPSPGARRRLAIAMATLAAMVNWIATSPGGLVHINWDAGSYLHGVVSGTTNWSSPPWNAHYALGYVYLAAAGVARWLGGTATDGLRLLNSVCLAAILALVVDAAFVLTRRRRLAALLGLCWLTSFVTAFLVLTLEDNIVFVAPGVAVLWLAATRMDAWGARESAAAGALAAAAALLSVQGLLYLGPPLAVALFRPGPASLGRRFAHAGAAVAGVAVAVVLVVLALAAVSDLDARTLFKILLARPEPSQFPTSAEGLRKLLFDGKGHLRALGLATQFQLFGNRVPWSSPEAVVRTGALVLAAQLTLLGWSTALAWRLRRGAVVHLMAALLLSFSLLTAVYRDVEYAYLKRTDFVPVMLVLLAAAWLGVRPRPRRFVVGATLALALLVAAQLVLAARWRAGELRTFATLDERVIGRATPGYHGRPEGGSHFRYYRALRRSNPGACAFVFDAAEVQHGRWNPDITGLIWAELPAHLVVGSLAEIGGWRRPLVFATPEDARRRLEGCEWISAAARQRLGLALQ